MSNKINEIRKNLSFERYQDNEKDRKYLGKYALFWIFINLIFCLYILLNRDFDYITTTLIFLSIMLTKLSLILAEISTNLRMVGRQADDIRNALEVIIIDKENNPLHK